MTTGSNSDAAGQLDTLFEHLPDPVVKFKHDSEGDPVIIKANTAFKEVFAPNDSVAGCSLNDLIVPADRREEAAKFDQRTAEGESTKAVVERSTNEGRRKFLYRSVPAGEDRYFAIYSDVTEKLNQERYLEVLQRILRHNLRNKVNVINGQVSRALENVDDDQAADAIKQIEETSNGLTHLCEEAQTIRKVLGGPQTLEPINLENILDDVTNDCLRRFTQATITVDCPTDLMIQANDQLRTVVDSLIDNAIRHNTSSLPKVTVSASIVTEDTIELAVADNGPGIPETERRLFTDGEQITPLSHGSGLGLWLVKWITESYGGEMSIDTPNDGGSIVRLTLPRVNN